MSEEPLIHSHITAALDDSDPLAWKVISCKVCKVMVHCSNNECMQTWVETGIGNYCIKCFAQIDEVSALDDVVGLDAKRAPIPAT